LYPSLFVYLLPSPSHISLSWLSPFPVTLPSAYLSSFLVTSLRLIQLR
jgi:hypothetical protein